MLDYKKLKIEFDAYIASDTFKEFIKYALAEEEKFIKERYESAGQCIDLSNGYTTDIVSVFSEIDSNYDNVNPDDYQFAA